MTKHDLNNYSYIEAKNNGIRREWMACAYYGIPRSKHDSKPYDVASDIEIPGKNISVKSSEASLMCGTKCRGCHSFHGIWCRFRRFTHSDYFLYVTKNYIAYEMDINEFSKFIHLFARLSRDANSKGGNLKIQIRKENQQMLEWLDGMAA